MRGLFTCGIMDVLMEEGITFDGAAGISAGAVFGVNFKSKQIGRPLRYNTTYCKDPRYCSLKSLITTGDLYGVDFCYREIPEHLDVFDADTFAKNPMEFHIGATDIKSGEIVYHKCTDGGKEDGLWMRASASMPLVSRPVEINGNLYLDGGVVDSIPYHHMKEAGFDRCLVILTQPEGFVKGPNKLIGLMKIFYKKYPKLIEAMETRHIRYNEQVHEVREDEKKGLVYVLCPETSLHIGRTEKDPAELKRVYQEGRKIAEKHLEAIRDFLKS